MSTTQSHSVPCKPERMQLSRRKRPLQYCWYAKSTPLMTSLSSASCPNSKLQHSLCHVSYDAELSYFPRHYCLCRSPSSAAIVVVSHSALQRSATRAINGCVQNPSRQIRAVVILDENDQWPMAVSSTPRYKWVCLTKTKPYYTSFNVCTLCSSMDLD